MKPREIPSQGASNLRTCSIIPQAVFRDSPVPLGGHHTNGELVGWKQILIAAISSSYEDGFALFSGELQH